MNHDEYREKLSALLDGELNEAEQTDVMAHLESCEACWTYLIELTDMRDALSRMDTPSVPEGFAAGVMARLRETRQEKSIDSVNIAQSTPNTPKRSRNRRLAASFAAAAAVLVIVSVPRMLRMGGAGAPETAPSVQSSAIYGASGATNGAAAEAFPAESTEEEAPLMAAGNAPMLAESKQMLDGGTPAAGAAMAELMEEAPVESTTNTAAAPETAYDAAMDALPEEESRKAAPVMTLMGDGAADWLAEHGEDLGDGRWLVRVEDVNALPDTLELVAEDGLQRPTDGMLVIVLGATEATP